MERFNLKRILSTQSLGEEWTMPGQSNDCRVHGTRSIHFLHSCVPEETIGTRHLVCGNPSVRRVLHPLLILAIGWRHVCKTVSPFSLPVYRTSFLVTLRAAHRNHGLRMKAIYL